MEDSVDDGFRARETIDDEIYDHENPIDDTSADEVLDDDLSVDGVPETEYSTVGWLWYINERTDERGLLVHHFFPNTSLSLTRCPGDCTWL